MSDQGREPCGGGWRVVPAGNSDDDLRRNGEHFDVIHMAIPRDEYPDKRDTPGSTPAERESFYRLFDTPSAQMARREGGLRRYFPVAAGHGASHHIRAA